MRSSGTDYAEKPKSSAVAGIGDRRESAALEQPVLDAPSRRLNADCRAGGCR